MDFLSIDELITRYKKRVKKAEQLNSTDNKYYTEKKSIIHWLCVLKSYINPSYDLAQAQTTNVYNDILFDSIEKDSRQGRKEIRQLKKCRHIWSKNTKIG